MADGVADDFEDHLTSLFLVYLKRRRMRKRKRLRRMWIRPICRFVLIFDFSYKQGLQQC